MGWIQLAQNVLTAALF